MAQQNARGQRGEEHRHGQPERTRPWYPFGSLVKDFIDYLGDPVIDRIPEPVEELPGLLRPAGQVWPPGLMFFIGSPHGSYANAYRQNSANNLLQRYLCKDDRLTA
jgi:hypothetical protein